MTIYLIHGLLESSLGQFAQQVRRWHGRHTLIPLELPGHANSPLDAGSEFIGDAVGVVVAAMERHGSGHVIAASYLGSPVAVRYASRPDARATSLVLMGFVPEIPADVFTGWMRGFYALPREHQPLADAYDRIHGPRWTRTLDSFAATVSSAYDEQLAVSWAMLQNLHIPVLIANGSLKSSERDAARRAAVTGGLLQGRIFDGAGHVPSRDCPEQFADVVETFWQAGVTWDYWATAISAVVREEGLERELDSLERISVRAYLAGKGIEFPRGLVPPSTIKEWATWVVQHSNDS